jgi:hypothetical protein
MAMPLSGRSILTSNYGLEKSTQSIKTDLVIAGAGLGGTSAALAALRNNLRVVLIEETDWIGGQISQQGVPPDEHQWIETMGAPASYHRYRQDIREYYRTHYPLTPAATRRKFLNPGDGAVSRLCSEPGVAQQVLLNTLAPYLSSGQLTLLIEHKAVAAEVHQDTVRAISVLDTNTGRERTLEAPYFIDATELGDLLPLTETEYITGAESIAETKEIHAAQQANPENNQAFTMCFAMDYVDGENFVADPPPNYDFWEKYIPPLKPAWSGKLLDLSYSNPKNLEPKELGFHPDGRPTGDKLNLWNYRRIINRQNFTPGFYQGDITIVNWPQNDYMEGNLIDASPHDFDQHINRSKELSLALFYWLQTKAPRMDGGMGWPGLRLRGDIMGTSDGLAKYPYIRESRRIKALFTVLEEHVGAENRKLVSGKETAAVFSDSVGIGYYHIDLHPSCAGDNYIDFASLPFQIPLGALIPQRTTNLLPANKNIGTTHITNGCYRLHPVEWSIGEAAGLLATQAISKKKIPKEIRDSAEHLGDFQNFLENQGIQLQWPAL